MSNRNCSVGEVSTASNETRGPVDPEHRLRMLADSLAKSGLQASLATYAVDNVRAMRSDTVTIANQSAPERGIMYVEDDGCVTWEFAGSLDDAGLANITDEALNILHPINSARTGPAGLISRISVTYVTPGFDAEREIHLIGLTSNANRRHIQPARLQELLDMVALCCEDVLANRRT